MAYPTVVPFDISKHFCLVKEQKQGIFFKTKVFIEG